MKNAFYFILIALFVIYKAKSFRAFNSRNDVIMLYSVFKLLGFLAQDFRSSKNFSKVLFADILSGGILVDLDHTSPVGIYMFKINNRNTRTRCEISSKLTIKTPE